MYGFLLQKPTKRTKVQTLRFLRYLLLIAVLLSAASAPAQEVSINGHSTLNAQLSTSSNGNGHGWGKGGKPKPSPTPNLDPQYIPTSGTTSWNDSANWTPPTVPNATGAQAVFLTPTANQIVTLDGDKTVGSLSLTNDTLFTWTLTSGTGGSLIFSASSGNATLSVNGTGFGVNEISANVILNGTLEFSGTRDITISGAISGSGGIIANGSTLKLSGNNSYSGGTTISSGLLLVGSSNALASGSVTVNGGILDLGGNNLSVGNLTGSGGTIRNNLGPGGTATLTIGSGNAGGGNYQGTITDNTGASSGILALTKTGSGTITLSGANTYSGATTVNGGTLFINGDQTLATGTTTVSNSGTVLGGTGTIGGGVTLASSGTILEAGTGSTGQTLTIKGALTQSTTGSIIQLALGASGAHSTLALTGAGQSSFNLIQHISIIDLGATAGTSYNGIITGVSTAVDTATWTIDNAGWTGTFTYDAIEHDIDLTLIAVPEPSTWVAAGLACLTIGYMLRRRFIRRRAKA